MERRSKYESRDSHPSDPLLTYFEELDERLATHRILQKSLLRFELEHTARFSLERFAGSGITQKAVIYQEKGASRLPIGIRRDNFEIMDIEGGFTQSVAVIPDNSQVFNFDPCELIITSDPGCSLTFCMSTRRVEELSPDNKMLDIVYFDFDGRGKPQWYTRLLQNDEPLYAAIDPKLKTHNSLSSLFLSNAERAGIPGISSDGLCVDALVDHFDCQSPFPPIDLTAKISKSAR